MAFELPKQSGSFSISPEGVHTAKVAAIVDRGIEATQFGDKHRVTIIYVYEAKGELHQATDLMTLSTHPKSNMFKLLEKCLGKGQASQCGNLTEIVGKPVGISVVHAEVGEKTYANVESLLPAQGDGPNLNDWTIPNFYVETYGHDNIASATAVPAVASKPQPEDKSLDNDEFVSELMKMKG